MKILNIANHYWTLAGSTTEVYSSATNTMVPVGDPAYAAWLAAFNEPSPIGSIEELPQALRSNGSTLPEWLLSVQPTFIQPTPTTYTPEQLKAYNADTRWRKEQGGITTTAGFPIKTDDRAQAKITGVYTAQKEVPAVVTTWHDAVGTVHELDAAGMYGLHVDLLTHINDCFARSANAIGQIDAGSITNLETIDAIYAADITEARKNWLKKQD